MVFQFVLHDQMKLHGLQHERLGQFEPTELPVPKEFLEPNELHGMQFHDVKMVFRERVELQSIHGHHVELDSHTQWVFHGRLDNRELQGGHELLKGNLWQ